MEENRLQDKLMEILELNRETIEKTAFVKLLEKMVEKYEGEKREMDDCLSDRDFINGLDVANNHRGEDVMDFTTYQELSKRTMPEDSYREVVVNYALGLAGEVGEYVDLIKKEVYHGHPVNNEKKKKELGDVLHYVAGQCTLHGWTMEEVATLNIAKLGERYPKGFCREDSVKRVDVKAPINCPDCGVACYEWLVNKKRCNNENITLFHNGKPKIVFKEEELQKQYEHLNAVGEITELMNGDK